MLDLLNNPLARIGKSSIGNGGSLTSKPGEKYAIPWSSMG